MSAALWRAVNSTKKRPRIAYCQDQERRLLKFGQIDKCFQPESRKNGGLSPQVGASEQTLELPQEDASEWRDISLQRTLHTSPSNECCKGIASKMRAD